MSKEEKPLEELEKWRLMLGGDEADGTDVKLRPGLQGVDESLTALYDFEKKGKFKYNGPGKGGQGKKGSGGGGSEGSNPGISRWLGDIRKYFPSSVVKVMQNDAMKHPELQKKMLFEPEILEKAEADVHLVVALMELGKLIPSKTKDTARRVVQKVVDELMSKLEQRMVNAVTGALNKSARKMRPRHNEINWEATIKKNLKHYQKKYNSIIPETLIGYGRKSRRSLKDVIMCIDQSGSMGTSVVYSGIFGAVMASLPNVKTKMVVFDTQIVDLTEDLKDPVDLLFGVQLGGGTDINGAVQYCQSLITKAEETIMVLITDLEEGGDQTSLFKRCQDLVDSGVQLICLLALSDEGSPSYDQAHAERLSAMGVPVFACTPDVFPDLMAAAIEKQDLKRWAGDRGIVVK
jgi:Mg-chelatase subunit ChlD